MLELGVKMLLAYLLGSLMGALAMGWLRGVDIRDSGSGNAGGTNALRTQGFAFALGVVVIDVGKALLAVGVVPGLAIPFVAQDPAVARDWLAIACATAVVAGHVWPMFHGFRGGKGAATMIGALAVLAPLPLLPALAAWFLVVFASGYVGLATMTAAITLPVAIALMERPLPVALFAYCVAMALFIVWTHRANIARMRAGGEHRVSRLWLLKPREGAQ